MEYPTDKLEKSLRSRGMTHIAGCDEAGRGAWAGPLAAAAVILPAGAEIPGLRDSKTLPEPARERLYKIIVRVALAHSVVFIPSEEIDNGGVHKANMRALEQAIRELELQPDHVVSDYFDVSSCGVACTPVVDGDTHVLCVAAAAIVAKVSRDRLMRQYHLEFPRYGFGEHKGYGTEQHQKALALHGITRLHRTSFAPIKAIMNMRQA